MATTDASTLLDPGLLEQVKGLTLVARRIVEGVLHGLHHSPVHGLSIEFVQHRPYTPGDEIKHLDWRVLGRSDRYVIKEYQQETNLRAVIFLDCSRSMAYGGVGATSPTLDRLQHAADDLAARTIRFSDPAAEPVDSHGKFPYARRLTAALAYLLLHQGDRHC